MGRNPDPKNPGSDESKPGEILDIAYAKRWLKKTRRAVESAAEPAAKLMAVVRAVRGWDSAYGSLNDAVRVLEGRMELKEARKGNTDRFVVGKSLRIMRLAVPGQKRGTASNWASALRAIIRGHATELDLKAKGIHGLANANRPKAASKASKPDKGRSAR